MPPSQIEPYRLNSVDGDFGERVPQRVEAEPHEASERRDQSERRGAEVE